jgi:hypothetical protein
MSIAGRLFTIGAVTLLVVAVVEKSMNLIGYTILDEYPASRLATFAGILMIFVGVDLLRQMRDEMVKKPR